MHTNTVPVESTNTSPLACVAPPGAPNTLLTQESTPLEPDVLDHKMYVRGIGTVLEQTEKGGNERNELVSLKRGR